MLIRQWRQQIFCEEYILQVVIKCFEVGEPTTHFVCENYIVGVTALAYVRLISIDLDLIEDWPRV